ncbi:MAG: hypothetical protein WBX37_23420, partial [Pseudolabrys sp.]
GHDRTATDNSGVASSLRNFLSDQDRDIAAMPGGARQYRFLTLSLTQSSSNFGPRRRDPYGSRLRTIKRFSGRRL